MRAFKQLIIANIKENLRDTMQLIWFLLFPLVIVLIFGLIFSKNIDSVKYNVGIVNMGTSDISSELEKAIESVPSFNVVVGAEEEETKAFKDGKREIVVIIPESLSSSISNQESTQIPVYYNQENPVILFSINEIINDFERSVTGQSKLLNTAPYLTQRVHKNKASRVDEGITMILAITLMQLGLFGAIRMVGLRERKILKSLGATPLPRILLIVSEIIVRMMMSVLQAIIIITVGHYVFGLRVSGDWLGILGWVFLGGATFVSMGYMIATFVKTVDSGNGIIQLLVMPMLFLSGIFVPVEMMPQFLQPVVRVIPLTYLADGLRSAITNYPPTYGLLTNILVLVGFLVVSLIFATRFKWE